MKSLSTLVNLYTSLSQNLTSTNQALGIQLLGDQQRYTIQKYFDNERTATTTTVGSSTQTLTSNPNAGDTSATLSVAWPYTTGNQLCTFTGSTLSLTTTASLASGATSATLSSNWTYTSATLNTTFSNNDIRAVTYTNGSAAISWGQALSSSATTALTTTASNDSRSVLFTKNSTSISWADPLDSYCTTSLQCFGLQYYFIPANISKITDNTITIGQLRYTVVPIQTRQDWDNINFLPYNSDIPQYAFIYNGTLGIFPIPSSTGNTLTFNYKERVPDFSTSFLFSDTSGTAYAAGQTTYDYQKGTASGSAGSTTITGASTPNWTTAFPTGDVTKYNLYFSASPTKGDGLWYPIYTIDSATQLTLAVPLVNAVAAGSSYSIAQLPVLQEDFHDMLVYGALKTYFSSIVLNPDKYKEFDALYRERLSLLEDYAGTKQINVDLGATPQPVNPNLFLYGQNSS